MDEIDWGQLASGIGTPGAGGMMPQVPQIPQSALTPEILAKQFAARGVPPPPVDVAPQPAPSLDPIRMPDNNVGSSGWRQDYDTMGGSPDVGAALTGKTVQQPPVMAQGGGAEAPMNLKSSAQMAGEAGAAPAKPGGLDKFADALKGVKAPANPEIQRLGTPAAPKATAVKGGDIIALLQALNAAPGASEYKLPSTLGAAIRK